MKAKAVIIVVILVIFLAASLISCNGNTNQPNEEKAPQSSEAIDAPQKEAEAEAEKKDEEAKEQEAAIDLQKIKPNENGRIMLLMYHGISDKESEWVRTPENFRRDLQTLYEKGYRIISLKDYIDNDIKVEAGFTPVVLTFDDGLLNQFNYIEVNGERRLDPDCAVGILEEYFKKYPDFGRGGSFYVFYPLPFRQKELIKEKYEFLIQNGYEVGNHAYTHENLGKISANEVQKALALNVVNTRKYIENFEVFSLALPYGASPKGEDYKYVVSGEYEGTQYNHKAVLLVGSNPAPSPNSIKFDASKLPRIRASEMNTAGTGIYDWLTHFEKNPHERYISDGNPDTITIPEEETEKVNLEAIKDKKLVKYLRQ